MSNTHDGGFAFPQPTSEGNGPLGGMSMRDWFAGQALTGLLVGASDEMTKPQYAQIAYSFADAMLKARSM